MGIPPTAPALPFRLVAVSPLKLLAACFVSLWLVAGPASQADEQRDFFEAKIRPVLVKHCYECHSSQSAEVAGKLLVDSRDGMRSGGESGPVLLAGRPDESLIIQALRYDGLEMPPEAPLPPAVVQDFVRWIKLGAADPREQPPAAMPAESLAAVDDRESLWSFQPRQHPQPPAVNNRYWPRDPIDQFVLARVEAAGLQPTDDANARTLARRLYFDLIGLPPTAEQLDSFLEQYGSDPEAAKRNLVDQLLGSPQFGVRWGRHWLDVARYGESNGDDGLGRNATFPNAWRYRDYVIDAFNQDVPYDQFLAEQISGDLLAAESAPQRNRQLVATGFLAIGAKPAVAMNNNFAMDVVDDQINVVCTAVLGLSVACARCHDHKHDPIPTRDYYALAGIFRSTETLYGAAGNEKLTAPPTPLHELRSSLAAPPKRPDRSTTPVFPDGYSKSIDALNPIVHETLRSQPERLTVKPEATYSPNEFAAVKEQRFTGEFAESANSYAVSFWFRNSINNDQRPITAYLFSRGKLGDSALPGDHLGIGGTHDQGLSGKLFVFNGNQKEQRIDGSTVIGQNSWNHVVMIRDGEHVKVYLNGQLEIDDDLEATIGSSKEFCLAGRSDNFAPLTGNLGEVAVFPRALTDEQAIQLHAASGQPRGIRPTPPLGFAMGVREKAKPEDCKIHINGDGKQLGPAVPRGMLTAYHVDANNEFAPAEISIDANQSGRDALVAWLTHPDHPQTARVMVNRIWIHLFGRGIVTTPNDFGVYGARPSHPELLDYLANRFVANRWSIKQMIREIVLTRTYGLDSNADQEFIDKDPSNVWMSRHNRRRLDAESLRDSMLQVVGTIDYAPESGSAIDELDMLINWPPGEATDLHRESHHRSIYLCMLRHAPPKPLAAFDLPDGVAVTGQREVTTLPTQTLFLLNSDFVVASSLELADRATREMVNLDPAEVDRTIIKQFFSAILQRSPSKQELNRSLEFVRGLRQQLPETNRQQKAWAGVAQAMMTTNEFRYID